MVQQAGAGPSGLVAALTLLQNNVPVRIITKELDYTIGQRGSGVWVSFGGMNQISRHTDGSFGVV